MSDGLFDSREVLEKQTIKEFIDTKAMVLEVLEDSERARNCDKWLILKCLCLQGQDVEVINKESQTISWLFTIEELGRIKSFETLTRCRREIQNTDGCFLPTDPKVINKRRIREDVIKRFYGDKSRVYSEWLEVHYGIK